MHEAKFWDHHILRHHNKKWASEKNLNGEESFPMLKLSRNIALECCPFEAKHHHYLQTFKQTNGMRDDSCILKEFWPLRIIQNLS